ncbi:MAG: sulfotransferase domain-containing protein [bacterium]
MLFYLWREDKIVYLYRRIKYGQPIVIVSGLPRSGTSMLMKILEAGGMQVVTDGLRTADTDNPKGYYELEKVKELDKGTDKAWLAELRGKAVKIVSYFLEHLPNNNNYKVIFIERNLQEVIASQNKMLAHRGVAIDDPAGDEKMIQNYENHLRKVKYMLDHEPHFKVLFIDHSKLLKSPAEEVEKINRFLGGHLDRGKMAGVVDPSLYRNRK